MKIKFWGATDEVTGSMTFIEHEGKIGMIDCGLSQGSYDSDEKNRQPLPIDPKDISEIVVTHAHLDHSGYLPRLVKKGFKGRIICTMVTAELIKIILEDSASLAEDDRNPLYDIYDVQKTLIMISTETWNSEFEFLGLKAKLIPAGHILGASSLVIGDKKRIIFSGDLGRKDDFLIPAPPSCPPCDLVVIESTYGGKVRTGNMFEDLTNFLRKIKNENRVGIIASFALARGQMLISEINEVFQKHPELEVPLYFDSPMMKEVNEIYKRHHDLTIRPKEMVESLKEINSVDFIGQWKSLKKKHGPLVVLGSSGMVTGGRIIRHLENWQDDPTAILFLPGFQGENTYGRALKEGERTIYDDQGKPIIWSGEVVSSDAFSSHADQEELIQWLETANAKDIYLIHGEKKSKLEFKEKLEKIYSSPIHIPKKGDTVEIVFA